MPYEISLAEWSLHRSIESGALSHLDYPSAARNEFGIGTIELVNTLMDGSDVGMIREFDKRCRDEGVNVLLIMCDDEGDLSAPEAGERGRAIERHEPWLEAARALGCRAVRVNTGPERGGVDDDCLKRCAESCRRLLELAAPLELDVLIENHGGLSADPALIEALMRAVDHPRFGTLPDFGNFPAGTDHLAAVDRLLPFAKSVSAKCYDFDDETGEETVLDFTGLLDLVKASGYEGFLGIEYEGERLDEFEGIRRAKAAIEAWIASQA